MVGVTAVATPHGGIDGALCSGPGTPQMLHRCCLLSLLLESSQCPCREPEGEKLGCWGPLPGIGPPLPGHPQSPRPWATDMATCVGGVKQGSWRPRSLLSGNPQASGVSGHMTHPSCWCSGGLGSRTKLPLCPGTGRLHRAGPSRMRSWDPEGCVPQAWRQGRNRYAWVREAGWPGKKARQKADMPHQKLELERVTKFSQLFLKSWVRLSTNSPPTDKSAPTSEREIVKGGYRALWLAPSNCSLN